jgi:hypothetical protein
MSNDVNFADIDTRDEQMFQLRLSGMSVRKIAKQFNVTEAEAQKAIAEQCTPISQQMRKHTLELELDRLDEMEEIFYPSMKEKNTASGHLVMKIREMRADLLGYRAAIRVDATQIIQAAEVNSSDRIQRVLDDLATNRLAKAEPEIESDEG